MLLFENTNRNETRIIWHDQQNIYKPFNNIRSFKFMTGHVKDTRDYNCHAMIHMKE